MGPKMPVSVVCESPSDISTAIRSSLPNNSPLSNGNGTANDSNIQSQFIASAKRVLLSKIEYQEVLNFNNSISDTIKSKYIVLKPTTVSATNGKQNGNGVNGSPKDKFNFSGSNTDQAGPSKKEAELPTPKCILYARNQVQIGWKSTARKWQVGAGMTNMGNTCYLNSTLQALFHVPAFANWLMSDSVHRDACENRTGIQGGCINCAMAKTFMSSQQTSQPIKPYLVYSKLRMVCKHLVPGQQEDAHEFLRYLMEAMEKAYINRFQNHKQFDQFSKETTPVNQILGGYLKSSVRCLSCGHVSVTFQHFEDVLLDIRKANSVDEGLDLYFARERLEDMGYKCEACKKKVSATKQFSLERAPIALCIQLKRFSMAGNKINKHINIREHLNLSKYSSKRGTEQLSYRLVAMVTHLGASQHCGHYTAIGLTDAGGYYQFDDSCVRPISLQNVLNTNAYIIFYELESSQPSAQSWKPVSIAESNRQEPKNGISQMPKVCPSTQTSTKSFDANYNGAAMKRKIEINGKFNGSENSTEPQYGSKLVNSSPHTMTSGTKLTENGNNDNNTANRTNGISPFMNGKKKSDNLITIKLNNTPTVQNETASSSCSTPKPSPTLTNGHQTVVLPSLPSLDDPNVEIKIEPKVNGNCLKRRASTSSSDSDDDGATGNPRKVIVMKPTSCAAVASTSTAIIPEKRYNNSLVPYTSDDDDDDDDDDSGSLSATESVKTKAGPFQVTTTSPIKTACNTSPQPSGSAAVIAIKRNDSVTRELPNNRENIKTEDASKTPLKIKQMLLGVKRPNQTTKDIGDKEDVSKKLMKLNHRGYGANVVSWNGNRSCIDKEVDEDKKEEQLRQTLDADDADMDRGQTKKYKTATVIGTNNPGYNPFQEQQVNRNSWLVSNGSSNGHAPKARHYQVYHQQPNRNRHHHNNNHSTKKFTKRFFYHNNKNFHRRHSNK